MPHIALNSDEPGIRGLLRFRPETGEPLSELAEVLLRGPGTLTRGERELIAAYVSALNDCQYCSSSHSACAAAQLPGGMAVVEQVRADVGSALIFGGTAKRAQGLCRRRIRSPRGRRDGPGDPRHGPDRGRVLHVQPVRRRAGHDRPSRSRSLRSRGAAPRHGRLHAAGRAGARGLTAAARLGSPAHGHRPAGSAGTITRLAQ